MHAIPTVTATSIRSSLDVGECRMRVVVPGAKP